ncbi:syndetin isoform X1 [Nasonia vitripennis]|uniref:Syndetin n=1 Tax=Nasonia vitripennis TaxID=7425 RepID=A0A7M7R1K0_NASVI|nr:syndetin isoform X1 [Nasonia vitripennis]XP_032457784.1 syndetin isoform X1 [Nasonia vitripennis]XP_032457785.1 syndetin isoform X1 [Nasonia vitripennis]
MKSFTNDYLELKFLRNMELDLSFSENSFTSDFEILESTYEEYFSSSDSFNASRFELMNVPKRLVSEDITAQCKRLIRQYNVILKKVLLLILDKQVKFQEQFNRVIKIQEKLDNVLKICESCRNNLKTASHHFSLSSLLILYYCRKRKILKNLIMILYGIKTLNRTKDKLQQLLDSENYPTVIALISDCKRSINTYKQYNCVVAVHDKLMDTLEFVEENLDMSISKICTSFNANNYASAQDAYKFLGKSQTAIDQLHMHFIATIHSTALSSVLKYAQNDMKSQYNLLCQYVPLNKFYPCLLELCESFLSIWKSYYFVMKWHENEGSTNIENNGYENIIKDHNQKYILQKLQAGIVKVCNDVETKLIIFIDGFDLMNLKFEELLQALNTVDRMLKIGKILCKSNMTKLYECSKNKLLMYFDFYHASRLEELKIFLENDGWGLCPIKSSFRVTQLLEFKQFKYIFNLSQNSRNTEENLFQIIDDFDIYDFNQAFSINASLPFDLNFDKPAEEDILRSSEENRVNDLSDDTDDEEILDELKYSYVDDIQNNIMHKMKDRHTGPIVTNTSLTVLRICGKYLQITRIFKELAKTVTHCMIQIFELYFYSVYCFFSTDLINTEFSTTLGTNLKRTISRIKENLIISEIKNSPLKHKVCQPHRSSVINLDDSKNVFGLTERIVAVESLIFLGHQYESFQLYLNSIIIDDQEKIDLNQSYFQSVPLTTALRKPVYMAAILRAFDVPHIIFSITKEDWELKDIMSQQNSYINFLIEDIRIIKEKISVIECNVPLTKEVSESIWESTSDILTYLLVEGFSAVKRCSNEGRALMQLDFTQFVAKFETITALRPMPHQEFVTTYIKAYYLPESSIESWIRDHSEYSPKQLIGLVTCINQNKRIKQRLLSVIEEQRLTR